MFFYGSKISIRQIVVIVGIAITNERVLQLVCESLIDLQLFAAGINKDFFQEEAMICLAWAIRQCRCNLALQLFGKLLIGFTCDNG